MRCPACRAEVEQGPQCRRCRTDLSLLWKLEAYRRRALDAAYAAAGRGDWTRARCIAEGVDTLRKDEESQRLLAVSHLLCRDFARAWECYQGATNSRGE